MLSLLAIAATIAAPIDPAVACQVNSLPIRPCPIRPESTPSYLEEYEDGVTYRLGYVWVTPTRLRVSDLGSGGRTEIDLDADGNTLRKSYFQGASDTVAEETREYFYRAGRLDSVTMNWGRYAFFYAAGRLDSLDVYRAGVSYERSKEYFKYAYDPQGQVLSVLNRTEDTARNEVYESRTEFAYHWPDSVTSKYSSSIQPNDTTFGTVYLRDGLIRKKTYRRGRPTPSIIYMLTYWYAGETPGSIARAARLFARPAHGTAVDALGIRYPSVGRGERGRIMFPAGAPR